MYGIFLCPQSVYSKVMGQMDLIMIERELFKRYFTHAEYQCILYMKRYCDEHFIIHSHSGNYEDPR